MFSFDHHTDTNDPFLYYCYHYNEKMENLISKMKFNDESSINDAVLKLKNDEHIKTALKIELFDKAFIISHSNTDDFPMSVQEKARERYGEDSIFRAGFLKSNVSHMSGGLDKERRSGVTLGIDVKNEKVRNL